MKFRACLLAGLFTITAMGQQPSVLVSQTFEATTGGWVAAGDGGRVRLAAGQGSRGSGALAFKYQVGAKRNSGMICRLRPSSAWEIAALLGESRPFHRAGNPLGREETRGGNYTAWFWAPANTWQEGGVLPADFTVADGPRDPKDQDGRLDMDAVEGIGIFESAEFFRKLRLGWPGGRGGRSGRRRTHYLAGAV